MPVTPILNRALKYIKKGNLPGQRPECSLAINLLATLRGDGGSVFTADSETAAVAPTSLGAWSWES